jgi:hypothetical protein
MDDEEVVREAAQEALYMAGWGFVQKFARPKTCP